MKKTTYEVLKIGIKDTSEAMRGKDIYYKCNICQLIVSSTPKDNVYCSCNNISIDKDLNRMFVKDKSNFVILKRIT